MVSQRDRSSTQRWFDRGDLRVLVAAIVAVALAARLIDLGTRIAHWDEARVAYWTVRAVDTGAWTYRPIIHGPLLQHVARWLFSTVGTSDFVMRLPVAVVGGLLPAVALCFRSRLRRREVVALAVVLAADPLVLYYGRFFRNDVPVAAFALLALGAGVRAIDADDPRWWSIAGLAAGLALATKENALLYPLAWAGAGVLTLALARVGGRRPTWPDATVVREYWRGAWPWIAGAGAIAFAVVIFAYAPRTAGPTGGLNDLATDPASLGPVIEAATVGAAGDLIDLWIAGGMRDHSYPLYLGYDIVVLIAGSLGTIAAAAVGVARDRRPIVVFGTVWGLTSIVGYAYVADVRAPWLAVHAIVALAIPAAVGLVALADRARHSTPGVGLDYRRSGAIALLAVVAVHTAVVGGVLAYHHPEPRVNFLAQGAQPGDNFRPTMDRVAAIAAVTNGPDIAWAGGYAVANETATRSPPPPGGWLDRLPLPWYVERADATQVSVADPAALDDPPPVVIAPASDRARFGPHLPGYDATEFARFRHGENTTYRIGPWSKRVEGRSTVVWIDRDALDRARTGPTRDH